MLGALLLWFAQSAALLGPWLLHGCTIAALLAGAALLGLATATRLALWRGATRVPGWTKKPAFVTLMCLATSLGLTGYKYVSTRLAVENDERDIREREAGYKRKEADAKARFEACSRTDQLDQYCAGSRAVGVSANGQWLATSGKELVVWNIATGKAAWRATEVGDIYGPQSQVLVTDDGQHAVCVDTHNATTSFDASGRHDDFDDCEARSPRAGYAALSPGGKLLLLGEKACL